MGYIEGRFIYKDLRIKIKIYNEQNIETKQSESGTVSALDCALAAFNQLL